jgi:CRISPR type III-B/RAMP module RAMP protein Cmr6
MTLPHEFATVLGGKAPDELNPVVLYQKAHQRKEDQNKKTGAWLGKWRRPDEFLGQTVPSRVESASGESYPAWLADFDAACCSGVIEHENGLIRFTRTTTWRLVIGWSSNPALESGLELHPLLGFPVLPGAAIKGLLHHVWEMALVEESAPGAGDAVPPKGKVDLDSPSPLSLTRAIKRAAAVRALFGSLALERGSAQNGTRFGPETARERLEDWRRDIGRQIKLAETRRAAQHDWQSLLECLASLLDKPIGGLLSCFDAVPVEGSFTGPTKVLCVDVLTPHHSEYYGGSRSTPADTEDPVPTQFLAVAPGVRFDFRLRLAWPTDPSGNNGEDTRVATIKALGWDRTETKKRVVDSLSSALAEIGIGAKTAAGYGYLEEMASSVAATPANIDREVREDTPKGRGTRQSPAGASSATMEIVPAERPETLENRVARLLRKAARVPGGIEGLVDDAEQSLDEAEQRLLAVAIRKHHAARVRSWQRKASQGKPVASSRMAWLDRFSTEGEDPSLRGPSKK